MPDHYQQTGWGLGWQSFPVSAMIDELGVSALYWYARKDEAETTHPYYGEDGLKRNYVLAGKPPYPGFTTHATQRDGTALVVRTISRIHDDAIDLADQWVFRRGVNEVTRSGEWFIQQYGACALAVRPLARYATGAPELQPPEPETHVSGDDFLVRVPLHRAADGALVADRLESAWIIVVRDHVSDLDAFKEELRSVHVNDQARYVFDVPRMDYAYIRSVSLNGSSPSDEPLSLSVDYHSDLWR